MPENPADYEAYLPVEDRDDHFVNVSMPRSALRALERDARAHRQAQAERPTDTPLEDGEADMTSHRRGLTAGAPPDRPQLGDPYRDAREVHDKVIADGGMERHALGAALNSVVNSAHRGDQRVILGTRGMAKGD